MSSSRSSRRIGLRSKLGLGFGAGIVVLLVVCVVNVRGVGTMETSAQDVDRTQTVLRQLNLVESSINRAESSERGYVLSNGDAEYVTEFETATTEMNTAYDEAVAMTSDPVAAGLLDELRAQLDTKMASLTEIMAAFDASGQDGAIAAIASGNGGELMDELIATIDSVQARQREVLDTRQADSAATVSQTKTLSVVMALVGLGVALAAGALLSRSITRAVKNLSGVTDRMAKGDLSQRVEITSNDELGDMAVSMNSAIDAISDVLASITVATDQVAHSAGDLSAVSSQLNAAADDSSTQASSVSAATLQISTSIEMVAASAEEMTATIRDIAATATSSSDVATNAGGVAAQAKALVNELLDSSVRIGEVVRLISSVAEQTNLLALNATIEAARAGDAGKGFAVVAGEVKALAQQTGEATGEIANNVTAIQRNVQHVTEAIDAVVTVISDIQESSSTIAAAVEEQTATTQEIGHNVTEVATGTMSITRGITEVSTAVEQTADAATSVAEASTSLRDLAAELQSQVKRFTLAAK